MRTYSEKQGKKPFYWNEFLDKAINGKLTLTEIGNAESLASDWVTCACGNQCDIIPRNIHGAPDDDMLSELGSDFSISIDNGAWKEAKYILTKIETRSQEIIDQINKQNDGNNN